MNSNRLSVETSIVAVTVYQDRALITRQGIVNFGTNETSGDGQCQWELAIANLPMTVNTDSLRVRGRGDIAAKIFGARCERVYTTEPVAARAGQISQQIAEIEEQKRSLKAQLDAISEQTAFLHGLREQAQEQVAISLARKNMTLSDTLDLLNFIGSQYGEYAIASEDYLAQIRNLDNQLEVLRANLQQVQTPRSQESLNAIVPIEVDGEGEFQLEISYIVNYASWRPLYDLRVDSQRDRVNLSCFAEITQNTGEDWHNVTLQLSTAKPGLGTLPPKLKPWYINIPDPPLAPMNASPRGNFKQSRAIARDIQEEDDTNTDRYWEEKGAELTRTRSSANQIQAEMVTAQINTKGSTVSFDLAYPVSVDSDGNAHKRTVFNQEFPCDFVHIAMPSLVSFAYLQTDMQNRGDGAVLLPGKANIFRDDVFVGATNLEHIAPGEKFKINLGIDENIKINRELVERQVDKKLIGSDRKITYAYRVQIQNLGSREVKLTVSEQIPKSRHEKIKVKLNASNPPTQVSDMGGLEWHIELAAERQQEIYYQFIVEYPSNLEITGLDT